MSIIKPSRQLLTIWRLLQILASFVPAFAIFIFLKDTVQAIALVIWVVAFLFLFLIYLPLLYKSLVYIVDEKTVTLKRGVFYQNYYHIPLTSIQLTTIVKSPFSRLFGLVTLRIIAPGARLSLPGLPLKDARKFIGQISTMCGEVPS